MRRPLHKAWRALLPLLATVASLPSSAQVPERVYPVRPADGAVVGPRPVFCIGYEIPSERAAGELRFRITLDPRDRGLEPYDFDQRRRRSGWLLGDEGEVLYRPRKPLDDGRYRWRAWAWNGVDWVPGEDAFDLRVDSVPPAAVEGLRVRFDEKKGQVHLEWDPVTLDLSGRPEFVARYHVYRYERRVFPPAARVHEIGVVEQTRFVDKDPPPTASKILFYKVVAEDQAGNEAGRRD
jgi:hypothetical protein